MTDASVIGDVTYPDNTNMWDQAPNQPAGTSRAVLQRQLVQHIKALLGAG